ncbi:MAG: hypothetical protein ACK4NS_12495 [Saprospiraceae bacterium]
MMAYLRKKEIAFGLERLSLYFYFVLVTIALSTTTIAHYDLNVAIRGYVAILFSLVLLARVFLSPTLSRAFIVAALIFTLIYCYALVLSYVNGSFYIESGYVLINYILTVVGLFCLLPMFLRGKFGDEQVLSIYFFVALLFIVISGGLRLNGFFPVFIFEQGDENKSVLYSQGVSRFFGYTAIFALSVLLARLSEDRLRLWRVVVVLLVFLMSLLFSAAGGARGDFLFAFFLTISVLFGKFRHGWKILIFVVLVSWLLYSEIAVVDDFVIANRIFAIIEGDLGGRDTLLSNGLNLVLEEPACLIVGCGFGFYQHYWSFPYALYPHNSLLESVVLFGLPLTLIFLVVVFLGYRKYIRQFGVGNIHSLLFLYLFFVSLKSGSLFSNWLLISYMLCFGTLCFLRIRGGLRNPPLTE